MSLEAYRRAMQRTADTLYAAPEIPVIARFITYGCKEYLRRRGFITEGVLEYIELDPPVRTIADVQKRVASYYFISVGEMWSARRAREVCRPRQIAMYLAKQITSRSLPEIGRRFGNRDHTTVIHAVRQIEKLRAEDPEMDTDIKRLTILLEGA